MSEHTVTGHTVTAVTVDEQITGEQTATEHPGAVVRTGHDRSGPRRLCARLSIPVRRLRRVARRDDGMSTAEYAVGTVAAVGFSAALYKVVTSDTVVNALNAIITKALNATF